MSLAVPSGLGKRITVLLFDPRGRISRQDLLVAACLMLTLDMGLATVADGPALYALKALAYWIGGVGIIKRLHDVGRSGWWFLGGAMLLCMWSAVLGLALVFTIGLDAVQAGTLGYIALLAAIMLPAVGMTLWLHLAEGDPGMNHFGAVPEGIFAGLGGGAADEGAASQRP